MITIAPGQQFTINIGGYAHSGGVTHRIVLLSPGYTGYLDDSHYIAFWDMEYPATPDADGWYAGTIYGTATLSGWYYRFITWHDVPGPGHIGAYVTLEFKAPSSGSWDLDFIWVSTSNNLPSTYPVDFPTLQYFTNGDPVIDFLDSVGPTGDLCAQQSA